MNTLYLFGDSTCALKKEDKRPETGWGEMFYPFINDKWKIVNTAINGLSTRSCLERNIFSNNLTLIDNKDSAIIQFGHNDQKKDERGTDAWKGYVENLTYMSNEIKKKGASVYFVTSIPRRIFKNGILQDTHRDYIAAMKYAGYITNTPGIDLTLPLMIELQNLGEEGSKKYYMNLKEGECINYPEGKLDNSHLKPEGAKWVAREVAILLSSLTSRPNFLKDNINV